MRGQNHRFPADLQLLSALSNDFPLLREPTHPVFFVFYWGLCLMAVWFFFLLFCFVGFFSAFLSFLKVLFVSDVYFCTSKWKRRRISSCRSTLSWRFWEQVTVTLRKFYMGPDTPFLSKLRFRDSAFVEFSHPGEKFLTVTLTVIRLA